MNNIIPYGKHYIDQDDINAVTNVLKNRPLTQGKIVNAFEEAVAEYVGAKYAVAMSSWTAGLHMACIAAGVDKTNSILTSPITFVASANAGLYCGGSVIFSDINEDTINLCPLKLKDTVKRKKDIRAIIPVHFAGLPCDMESISEIAKEIGSMVIEDAAHALGATYSDGSKVGSCKYSDMTGFSFHPVKSIAAGEGGMITTNNKSLYKRLLRLRSHGINKIDDIIINQEAASTEGIDNPWYMEMQELGYNYRITDIQCALGKSQLKKLPNFLKRRNELAKRYDKAFEDFEIVNPIHTLYRNQSSHHLYPIRIDFKNAMISRASLMQKLLKQGISTQVHYIPVTSHPFYQDLGFETIDYPSSLDFYNEALSIPLYFDLQDHQQDKVIHTLKDILES